MMWDVQRVAEFTCSHVGHWLLQTSFTPLFSDAFVQGTPCALQLLKISDCGLADLTLLSNLILNCSPGAPLQALHLPPSGCDAAGVTRRHRRRPPWPGPWKAALLYALVYYHVTHASPVPRLHARRDTRQEARASMSLGRVSVMMAVHFSSILPHPWHERHGDAGKGCNRLCDFEAHMVC